MVPIPIANTNYSKFRVMQYAYVLIVTSNKVYGILKHRFIASNLVPTELFPLLHSSQSCDMKRPSSFSHRLRIIHKYGKSNCLISDLRQPAFSTKRPTLSSYVPFELAFHPIVLLLSTISFAGWHNHIRVVPFPRLTSYAAEAKFLKLERSILLRSPNKILSPNYMTC